MWRVSLITVPFANLPLDLTIYPSSSQTFRMDEDSKLANKWWGSSLVTEKVQRSSLVKPEIKKQKSKTFKEDTRDVNGISTCHNCPLAYIKQSPEAQKLLKFGFPDLLGKNEKEEQDALFSKPKPSFDFSSSDLLDVDYPTNPYPDPHIPGESNPHGTKVFFEEIKHSYWLGDQSGIYLNGPKDIYNKGEKVAEIVSGSKLRAHCALSMKKSSSKNKVSYVSQNVGPKKPLFSGSKAVAEKAKLIACVFRKHVLTYGRLSSADSSLDFRSRATRFKQIISEMNLKNLDLSQFVGEQVWISIERTLSSSSPKNPETLFLDIEKPAEIKVFLRLLNCGLFNTDWQYADTDDEETTAPELNGFAWAAEIGLSSAFMNYDDSADLKPVDQELFSRIQAYPMRFGTNLHAYIDDNLSLRLGVEGYAELKDTKCLCATHMEVQQANHFMSFLKFEAVKQEFRLGSFKHKVCGSIDALVLNEGVHTIFDWKRTAVITRPENLDEEHEAKVSIDHVDPSDGKHSLVEYAVQMAVYRKLLVLNGYAFSEISLSMKLVIFHPSFEKKEDWFIVCIDLSEACMELGNKSPIDFVENLFRVRHNELTDFYSDVSYPNM